jgi:hypothetical protein
VPEARVEAGVPDLLVQRLAGHARLNGRIEILDVHRHHLAHLAQVDADAAVRGEHVSLDRRADAERDERRVIAAAEIHDVAHILGRVRESHSIRGRVREVRLVLAVMLPYPARGRDAVAEEFAEIGGERRVELTCDIHLGFSWCRARTAPLTRARSCRRISPPA